MEEPVVPLLFPVSITSLTEGLACGGGICKETKTLAVSKSIGAV